MDTSRNEFAESIFPKGDKAPPDYFTGSAWVRSLVPNDAGFNCVIANVVFEPGARNNWHTHPAGQILLVTEGKGLFQEKGKQAQVIQKGDVVKILPDVVHWHGAAPDSQLTHIAINFNSPKGAVVWLEKVTDEEYSGMKF